MRTLKHLNCFRVRHPLAADPGDDYNGAFEIPLRGRRFLVYASNGGLWDHVSVSLPDRCPTWEEMKEIKALFFKKNECAIEFHPPAAANISVHDYCLHLWRPQQVELPTPPRIMV